MTIPPDLEAQILRYYHVEKWRVGTIARQLHVHHGTVAQSLAQADLPRIGPPARRSQVAPYLPFIHQTLEKFPTLTVSPTFPTGPLILEFCWQNLNRINGRYGGKACSEDLPSFRVWVSA